MRLLLFVVWSLRSDLILANSNKCCVNKILKHIMYSDLSSVYGMYPWPHESMTVFMLLLINKTKSICGCSFRITQITDVSLFLCDLTIQIYLQSLRMVNFQISFGSVKPLWRLREMPWVWNKDILINQAFITSLTMFNNQFLTFF